MPLFPHIQFTAPYLFAPWTLLSSESPCWPTVHCTLFCCTFPAFPSPPPDPPRSRRGSLEERPGFSSIRRSRTWAHPRLKSLELGEGVSNCNLHKTRNIGIKFFILQCANKLTSIRALTILVSSTASQSPTNKKQSTRAILAGVADQIMLLSGRLAMLQVNWTEFWVLPINSFISKYCFKYLSRLTDLEHANLYVGEWNGVNLGISVNSKLQNWLFLIKPIKKHWKIPAKSFWCLIKYVF